MSTKFHLLALFPMLALTALGDPCAPSRKGAPMPVKGDVVFEIDVISPRLETIARKVETKGVFSPSDEVVIKAPTKGRIEKLYVGEGDRVQAEDPLITINGEELNAKLELKQAELKEAEAQLEYLKRTHELTGEIPVEAITNTGEPLFLDDEPEPAPIPEKTNDPKTLEATLAEEAKPDVGKADFEGHVKIIEMRLERINKELDFIEQRLGQLTLTAPISGLITKIEVSEGSQSLPKDALLTLVHLDPISVVFSVPAEVSSYIDKLVTVEAAPETSPEKLQEGTVYFISPALDPKTKTLEIKAHLPNEGHVLKAGQEARVWLSTRKVDKTLLLPKSCLIKEGDKYFAFVVSGQQVEKTEITILRELENHDVAIKARLRVDDLIAINQLDKLNDGSFIKIANRRSNEPKLDNTSQSGRMASQSLDKSS